MFINIKTGTDGTVALYSYTTKTEASEVISTLPLGTLYIIEETNSIYKANGTNQGDFLIKGGDIFSRIEENHFFIGDDETPINDFLFKTGVAVGCTKAYYKKNGEFPFKVVNQQEE